MALLVAEAAKLSLEMLERGIIEQIIDRDEMFALVPFKKIDGKAYVYNRELTLSEADFLSRVFRRTGCGWLLDVTNVYANSVNFRFDPYQFIAQVMPSAPRVQMHLAGGFFDDKVNRYIDSHSEPIPDTVWNLYRFALQQAGDKTDAVFIERDQDFPNDAGWRNEIRQARRIAEEVTSTVSLVTR